MEYLKLIRSKKRADLYLFKTQLLRRKIVTQPREGVKMGKIKMIESDVCEALAA